MQVLITKGSYRNNAIVDQVFTQLIPARVSAKGYIVTVQNEGQFDVPMEKIRITVESPDCVQRIDDDMHTQQTTNVTPVQTETDEETMERIAMRFSFLEDLTSAACQGFCRSLIVSGPPGVGKSFGIMKALEDFRVTAALSHTPYQYDVVKGSSTAIALYQLLYKFSSKGSVLVLDDIDTILGDEVCLNLLKGALDSGKRRVISWNSETRILADNGIPTSFQFDGAVIFITNLQLSSIRSAKIKEHMEALVSRSHYLDLTITTQREKMLRLKQVHRDSNLTGGLFADYDFTTEEESAVFKFMDDNMRNLRELSIRTALKVADLIKCSPFRWEQIAQVSLLK
jgi:hypothetical protein